MAVKFDIAHLNVCGGYWILATKTYITTTNTEHATETYSAGAQHIV